MSAANVNIILSAQLEAARNTAMITQTDLGKLLEVTPQMVSYLEKAGSDTRLSVLANWAAALGLEPALVPMRRRTLIVDNDDTVVAFRQLHKHALITGPDRLAAGCALLELRTGARLHHGTGLNSYVPANSVELERLDIHLFDAGNTTGSVLVDLDASDHDHVRQLLDSLAPVGRQRWSVVLLAEKRETVAETISCMIAEHLHTENMNVFRCSPGDADSEGLLLLGRVTEVLGTVIPKSARTDGALLGEDSDGNPVFLDLDELLKHSSIVGDPDLRRPVSRSVVAGMLDAGWDTTVINLEDGRDEADSRNWMRTYAAHHDVRYQELTLRPTEISAKLDPYTGLDAEALTAVVMASQEFEAPYYKALAELVVGQAVLLVHTAYHAGVREFPPTLTQIGKLLSAADLPSASKDLVDRARQAGAVLDDRNIEALLRPAKATLEAAAGFGARLSRFAGTKVARNVLVETLDEQTTLDLSARGVTYLGLDSWAQPELTDLIVESVVGRVLHTENHRGHAGSIRRVVLIEGAESAKDETVVKLLGRARANGVVVILSGNGPTEKEHVPGDSRNVTAEQQSRRLWNTNVRIAVGERREACTEVLETFGLTDEQRAAFSELQNGQVALLVVKPEERLIPVKVRIRKPHETLR